MVNGNLRTGAEIVSRYTHPERVQLIKRQKVYERDYQQRLTSLNDAERRLSGLTAEQYRTEYNALPDWQKPFFKTPIEVEAEIRAEQQRLAEQQAQQQAGINAYQENLNRIKEHLDTARSKLDRARREYRDAKSDIARKAYQDEIRWREKEYELWNDAYRLGKQGVEYGALRSQIREQMSRQVYGRVVQAPPPVFAPTAPAYEPPPIVLGKPREGVIVLKGKPTKYEETKQKLDVIKQKVDSWIEKGRTWTLEFLDPVRKEQRLQYERAINMQKNMVKNYESDLAILENKIKNYQSKYEGRTLNKEEQRKAEEERQILLLQQKELESRRGKLLVSAGRIERKAEEMDRKLKATIWTKEKITGTRPKRMLAEFVAGAVSLPFSLVQLASGLVISPVTTIKETAKGLFVETPKQFILDPFGTSAGIVGQVALAEAGGIVYGRIKGKIEATRAKVAVSRAKMSVPKIYDLRTETQIRALKIPEGATLSEAELIKLYEKGNIIRLIKTSLKPSTKADAKYVPVVSGSFLEVVTRDGTILHRITIGEIISELSRKRFYDISLGQAIGKLKDDMAYYYGGTFTGKIAKRFDPITGKIYDLYTGQILKTVESAKLKNYVKKGLSEAEIIEGELRLRKPPIQIKGEPISELLGFAERKVMLSNVNELIRVYNEAVPYMKGISFSMRKITAGKYEIFYKPTNQRFVVTRQTLSKMGLGTAKIEMIPYKALPILKAKLPKPAKPFRPPRTEIPASIKRTLGKLSKQDRDFAEGQILTQYAISGQWISVKHAIAPIRPVLEAPAVTFESAMGVAKKVAVEKAMKVGKDVSESLAVALTPQQIMLMQQQQLMQQQMMKQQQMKQLKINELSLNKLMNMQQMKQMKMILQKQMIQQKLMQQQQLKLKQQQTTKLSTRLNNIFGFPAPPVPKVPTIPRPKIPRIIIPPEYKETPQQRKRRKKKEEIIKKQRRAYQASVASAFLGYRATPAQIKKMRITGIELRPIMQAPKKLPKAKKIGFMKNLLG
jgi:hypothetical protein